ncbi:MAG TPA: LssY C-terminal domain-containing protein [Candidatus Acidoferrales bacterium]|nr:LssY C-terminal domain-containing protein [Candidatus Acidoferrales bacterium]
MRPILKIFGILAVSALCAALFADAQNQQQTSASSASGATAAPATAAAKSYELDVSGSEQWIDTNIDLRPGEKIHIAATGTLTYPAPDSSKPAQSFGPDGLARGWKDLIHQYAVTDGGHGALIGRLGAADAGGQPFLVGVAKDYQAPVAGRLFLGINQSYKDSQGAQGSFRVTIGVTDPGLNAAAAMVPGGPAETTIPGITAALLEKIPRRVSDPQRNPGDMVNILIVGSQDDLVQAFTAAGWVQVDRSVQDSVLAGLADSLSKKDYLTMPMSTLYLFGRPQDYGFAHAEAVRVAISRNHLRAWKSEYIVDGQTVWCIAATHDIGFERDQRNNGVTHKIDPAIDGEREYVNDTLSSTGWVIARSHVTPASPLTEAKTATGGSFHSDGRILVLVLKPSQVASN